jgi:hypothetical protein
MFKVPLAPHFRFALPRLAVITTSFRFSTALLFFCSSFVHKVYCNAKHYKNQFFSFCLKDVNLVQ